MNLQLLQNKSTLQPKKGHQRDPYIGSLHPQTKKRHGKGSYLYKNPFFQYEGQYNQGKKQGKGILKLNDGTKIQANFINDQIQGQGLITYPDGSFYKGNLQKGQKNGYGIYESQFEKYEGQWKQNSKSGKGKHQIKSTGQIFQGTFENNKLQGKGSMRKYNYSYNGQWNRGKRQGYGQQTSLWRRIDQENVENNQYDKKINYDSYEYKGIFNNNQFNGQGMYQSKSSNYSYEGQFIDGLPKNYPNEFRIFTSSNTKNQNGQSKQSDKTILQQTTVFQYQLEGDSKNIYIQSVYQGPQYLDEVQPTQQQIQQLIKNWQNQNKKNKNPPPMPDFRAPKMKKPQLILISQQNHRPLIITLQKQSQGKFQKMKIDYRKQIQIKRAQFEKIKEQQKKNEDEDPKKKGGKKQAKNENQFKINLFKQQPTLKQKSLKIQTENGSTVFKNFELPDDFPQGKFYLNIESSFEDFGRVKPRKIQIVVKSKQAATKKK